MIIPTIIFEDENLLVLDKPAGMIVNKSDTTRDQVTMQDWVEKYLKVSKEGKVSNVSNGETKAPFDTSDTFVSSFDTFLSRAGIVHRLDKETSGILLAAKNLESFVNLQAQFKERKVKKTYIALVHGKIDQEEGIINAPVGRLPWNRKRFGVLPGGRESVTRYRVISNFKFQISNSQQDLTLVELNPETGRTHQIRIHLQYIHHPIFADPLYAGRKTSRDDRKLLSRIFLHASKISFYHPARNASASVAGGPAKNEIVSFESPLPKELKDFVGSSNFLILV